MTTLPPREPRVPCVPSFQGSCVSAHQAPCHLQSVSSGGTVPPPLNATQGAHQGHASQRSELHATFTRSHPKAVAHFPILLIVVRHTLFLTGPPHLDAQRQGAHQLHTSMRGLTYPLRRCPPSKHPLPHWAPFHLDAQRQGHTRVMPAREGV